MYQVELYYPEINYYFTVTPGKDDFLEYLWEKQLNTKFDPCLYKYDDPGGRFYKALENQWFQNEIDEAGIIRSTPFKNYLSFKYKEDAYIAHGKAVGLIVGKYNLDKNNSYQITLDEPLF